MPRKCVVCGCSPTRQSGISLHSFPVPGRYNRHKARKWAEFAYPNVDWSDEEALFILSKKNRMICSQHFRPQDFIDPGRLIPLALPCHKPEASVEECFKVPGGPSWYETAQGVSRPWCENRNYCHTSKRCKPDQLTEEICGDETKTSESNSSTCTESSVLSIKKASFSATESNVMTAVPLESSKLSEKNTIVIPKKMNVITNVLKSSKLCDKNSSTTTKKDEATAVSLENSKLHDKNSSIPGKKNNIIITVSSEILKRYNEKSSFTEIKSEEIIAISMEKTEPPTKQLDTSASSDCDEYDCFGQQVVLMLRKMGESKAWKAEDEIMQVLRKYTD